MSVEEKKFTFLWQIIEEMLIQILLDFKSRGSLALRNRLYHAVVVN